MSIVEDLKEKREQKKKEKELDLQYGVKEKKGPGQYVLATLLILYTIIVALPIILVFVSAFTDEDAEKIKNALQSLFVNDTSSARPDGSMEIVKLFWFRHNCKDGQYSSAKVHRSVKVEKKDGVLVPSSAEDYVIHVEKLPDLEVEELEGK